MSNHDKQSARLSIDEVRDAAEKGDPDAQYQLGLSLSWGEFGPETYDEAAHWFHKAADQGSSLAMVQLGQIYEKDRGEGRNIVKAAGFYLQAANQKDNSDALMLLRHAAKIRGLPVAQNYLARWFHEAADQGNTLAMVELAQMYELGFCVGQDISMAAWYYQLAVNHKDYLSAVRLLNIAASDKNLPVAQFYFGIMLEKHLLRPAQNPQRNPAYWYQLSWDQGYLPAKQRYHWLLQEQRKILQEQQDRLLQTKLNRLAGSMKLMEHDEEWTRNLKTLMAEVNNRISKAKVEQPVNR